MNQTTHYTPNQFFLKREEGVQHGGVKITAMTHIPRILTEASALALAAELVKLAGGPVAFGPVLAAAYGGPEKLQASINATLAEQKAAAKATSTPAPETKPAAPAQLKPAAPVTKPPVPESPAEFAARTGAPLVSVPKPAK
jgi:hypothetical protein